MHLARRHRGTGRERVYHVPGSARAGLAAKKKSVHATERDTDRVRALRQAFIEAVQQQDFSCFKFVDETSTNLTYCRRYARAIGGQRAAQAAPLHNGPNVTLVATLTTQGLHACMTVSGAVNGDVFAAYLAQVLGPTLVAGDVVVLDNLPAHKVAGLAELVEARGARLLYLPPYSPDFNPIEWAFSKLKTWLCTAQARTREALEAVIADAANWISEQDAKNWFDHCGYHVQ
ncbi:IS630 family transposase [Hymenobacter lapidiphilus]|uniref:IS630 family transposase n=1 Tax=Hymenobacter lapidiphilus TaxID=2608003 RepID=UPI00293BFC1D|nr:IS630 family transposase [Hymenobacter lapidiphilus]